LIKLVFVVDPPADTQLIKEQAYSYTQSKEKADRGRDREIFGARVAQYLLKIDLDERLREMRSSAGYKRRREEDDEVVNKKTKFT